MPRMFSASRSVGMISASFSGALTPFAACGQDLDAVPPAGVQEEFIVVIDMFLFLS